MPTPSQSVATFAILFMQAGLVFLEIGHCRTKNVKSIIYKNGLAAFITILVWYFWAADFAIGTPQPRPELYNDQSSQVLDYWFYLMALNVFANGIIAGAVTDRMKMWVFALVVFCVAGVTFPLLIYFSWSNDSTNNGGMIRGMDWLFRHSVQDIAGAGYVHIIGGFTAFVCAWACGPREGRFIVKDGKKAVVDILPYDTLSSTVGTWILVFCWLNYVWCSCYYFASETFMGVTSVDDDGFRRNVGEYSFKMLCNSLISLAASAWMSTTLVCIIHSRMTFSLQLLNNSVLGGLVAITCSGGSVDSVGAFFIGVGAGIVAYLGPNFAILCGVDDPRDVFTVHGLQAVWGLFAVGLWATKDNVLGANYNNFYGAFYSGDGKMLGYQLSYVCYMSLITIAIALIPLFASWVASKFIFFHKGDALRLSAEEAEKEVSNDFPFLFTQITAQEAAALVEAK